MSLHDVSKNHDRRALPAPNQNDQQGQRLAHGTTQNQNSVDEAQTDGLKFKERQIIAVQDGLNKAAFGFYGSANKFGLKVAQDDVDVLTASNSQLVFNSEQDTLKIVGSGTLDVPAVTLNSGGANYTSNTSSFSMAHGLGYTPIILAFWGVSGSSFSQIPLTYLLSNTSNSFSEVTLYVAADGTNVSGNARGFGFNINTSIGGYTLTYYLLQESAPS